MDNAKPFPFLPFPSCWLFLHWLFLQSVLVSTTRCSCMINGLLAQRPNEATTRRVCQSSYVTASPGGAHVGLSLSNNTTRLTPARFPPPPSALPSRPRPKSIHNWPVVTTFTSGPVKLLWIDQWIQSPEKRSLYTTEAIKLGPATGLTTLFLHVLASWPLNFDDILETVAKNAGVWLNNGQILYELNSHWLRDNLQRK